jgi:DNA-binding IclR family transcriptional regulator
LAAQEAHLTSARVERIFSALQQLQGAPAGLTMTELGERIGLAPSSTHDLLSGLLAAEVIVVRRDRRYSLGPRVIGLAFSIVGSLDSIALADQDAVDLSERISEDVLLGVRVGDAVMYAVRHEGSSPLKVDVRLGEPRPLHATSVGKLFAAYDADLRAKCLDRPAQPLAPLTAATITDPELLERDFAVIRDLGVAVSNQEAIAGVVGFAAPVFDADGALALAVHVSLPVQRATPDHLGLVVSETVRTAADLTKRLAGLPPPSPPDLVARVMAHLELPERPNSSIMLVENSPKSSGRDDPHRAPATGLRRNVVVPADQ